MKRFSKLMNNSKTSTFLMIVFVVLFGVLLYLLFGRRLIEGVGSFRKKKGSNNPFVTGPKQNPAYNSPPPTPPTFRRGFHDGFMHQNFNPKSSPSTLRRNSNTDDMIVISPSSSPSTLRRNRNRDDVTGFVNPVFSGFDTPPGPSYTQVVPDYPLFTPGLTPPSTPELRRKQELDALRKKYAGKTPNKDEKIEMHAVGAAAGGGSAFAAKNLEDRIAMKENPNHPLHGVTLRRHSSQTVTTKPVSVSGYEYVPMSPKYMTPEQQISGYLIPGQQFM